MLFFDQVGLRNATDGFVPLTEMEYQVLYLLYLKDCELVSRNEMIDSLLIDPTKFVYQLRRKIYRLSNEKYITTVYGRGYMLLKKIEHLEAEDLRLDVISSQLEYNISRSLNDGQNKIFTAFANPNNAHLTERELAQELGLKLDNFKYHRKKLYEAIGAVSRTHATQIAQQYYAQREVE